MLLSREVARMFRIKSNVSKGITTATVVNNATGEVGVGQSKSGFKAISKAVKRVEDKKVDSDKK